MKDWFVYIIQSEKDNSYYTGISKDIEKRLKAHNSNKGAKRTKGRGPWVIIWESGILSKSDALKLEYKIKKMKKSDKENMK